MKSKTSTELDLAAAEYARFRRCERLQDSELLDAALNGAAKTIDNVTSVMLFVARYMPRGIPTAPRANAVYMEAQSFDRWWDACRDFLLEAGAAEDQLPKKPPAAGEPGFVSVLDEFGD